MNNKVIVDDKLETIKKIIKEKEANNNNEWKLPFEIGNYRNDKLKDQNYIPNEFVDNIEEDKIVSNLPAIECPGDEIYFKTRFKPQHADFIIGNFN